MMSVRLKDLLPATPQQPNEICLTLYFEVTDQNGLVTPDVRVMELLGPETGGWQEVRQSSTETIFRSHLTPKRFQSIFLISFIPQLSLHTKAVQVVLNLLDPVDVAWEFAAQWLYEQMYPILTTPFPTYLGYTVVYRATVKSLPDNALILDTSMLESVRWVHKPKHISSRSIICQQRIDNKGWLFLVDSPTEPRQGLIYVALGLENEPDFSSFAYTERNSLLARIDTFIHKSLIQYLELNSIYDHYELKSLEPLRKAINSVLNYVQHQNSGLVKLNDLAQQVANQRQFYSDLDRLEQSLNQQFNGLKRLFSEKSIDNLPELPRHHLNVMQSHREETQALVYKNRLLLETARTALAMVETQESKRTHESQERFNLTVAIVGVFLAAEQILDNDFAKHLLQRIGHSPTTGDDLYWEIFLTRSGSALITTLLIYCISRLVIHLQK